MFEHDFNLFKPDEETRRLLRMFEGSDKQRHLDAIKRTKATALISAIRAIQGAGKQASTSQHKGS